ncbi:MAG: hypothetical protein ACR2PL_14500 [Dehalococcoidia bacterium]
MTRYFIDTTPLTALLISRWPVVEIMTSWMRVHVAATSILVYGEFLEGLTAALIRDQVIQLRGELGGWLRLRRTGAATAPVDRAGALRGFPPS